MTCHCPAHGGCPCDDPVPLTIRQVWHRVQVLAARLEGLERRFDSMHSGTGDKHWPKRPEPPPADITAASRADIIRRVANLAEHGDRRRVTSQRVARWLHGALDGDADQLREISAAILKAGG